MSRQFRYTAVAAAAKPVKGVVLASDEAEAARLVAGRGQLVLEVRPVDRLGSKPLSRRDAATLLRTIATLVESGAPIDQALTSAGRVHGAAVEGATAAVTELLNSGTSLSDAFHDSGLVRSSVVQGLLAAGEKSGRMARGLGRAADYLEAELELQSQVRQQLAYPTVLLVAGTTSLLFILGFVVPRFAALLDDIQRLPLSTRLLLAASEHVRTVGPLLTVLGVGLGFTAWRWSRSIAARRVLDYWLGFVPAVGTLRWALASERFCRALGEMIDAGVPLLTAIERAAVAADSETLSARSWSVRERIRAGSRLGAALTAEQIIPPVAAELIELGDESGRLPQMMTRAADLLARDVQQRIRTLVTLVEPTVVVGFGGIIALVAASLLQAVYSLRPGMP